MTVTPDGGEAPPSRGGAYDYDGAVTWEYRPELDGDPDPGEVVWAWVAFEDDPRVGKDRPLAVVGRAAGGRLVGLMLTSRDRDGEAGWLPIGSGPWDGRGRPSWVRIDRPLAVSVTAVRREGAVLPRATFDRIQRSVASGRRPQAPVPGGAPAAVPPRGTAAATAAPTPSPRPGPGPVRRLVGRMRSVVRRRPPE